jgi:hypothetical protein
MVVAGMVRGTLLCAITAVKLLVDGEAKAASSPHRLSISYEASYPANLYWLVNALAGYEHADAKGFRAWWQQNVGDHSSDEEHLKIFRKLRDTYRGQYLRQEGDGEKCLVPLPPPHGADLSCKFSTIFLSSRTVDETLAKSEILLRDADQSRFKQALRYFDRRFAPKWRNFDYIHKHAERFRQQAGTAILEDILEKAASFYGVAPEASLSVRVLFVFAGSSKVLYGNAFGGGHNLLVEIPQAPAPLDQADVVVHEICHMLDREGKRRESPPFIDALLRAGNADAVPTLGILSEGLATAIGQGVFKELTDPAQFKKKRSTPNGFYNDDAIDSYSKAIFPSVKAALLAGKSLTALAPDLLRGYALAFPDKVSTPRMFLDSYIMVGDHSDKSLFEPYFALIPPESLWRVDIPGGANILEEYPAATVVLPVTPADAANLTPYREIYGLAAGTLETLKSGKSGVFIKKRPVNGYVFMVCGADKAALRESLVKFATLPNIQEGWRPF